MAKLASKSGEKLELRPYNLEVGNEGWVLCYLLLDDNDNMKFTTTGSFLQFDELRSIVSNLLSCLNGEASSFELSAIEPNFIFSVRLTNNDRFSIQASYLVNFDYEEGEIVELTKAEKSISLTITKTELGQFVEQLSVEIDSLKK